MQTSRPLIGRRRRRHVPALGRRSAIVTAITLLLFGLGTGVASAHVTVNPGDVAAGSYAKITFRVPNESPKASTDSIQVLLPMDHPFPSVSVMPVPGWVATPKTVALNPPVTEGKFTLTEAVESVTWAAQNGNGVQPGEFQEFSLSVGPVPDVDSLVLPAIQTYSDGSVVKWGDVAAPGTDPHSLDHPAPVLTITKAGAPASGAENADGAVPIATGSGPPSATISAGDDTARILAAIALLIAAIAVLIAVLGWRRRPVARAQSAAAPSAAVISDPVAQAPESRPAPEPSDSPPAADGRPEDTH